MCKHFKSDSIYQILRESLYFSKYSQTAIILFETLFCHHIPNYICDFTCFSRSEILTPYYTVQIIFCNKSYEQSIFIKSLAATSAIYPGKLNSIDIGLI